MKDFEIVSAEEFNSMACDIANDYAQARQEMGPEDFQSEGEYMAERMGHYIIREECITDTEEALKGLEEL
jgi:hypothetical protein